MGKVTEPKRVFEKIGPCLYRYTATGTYYALVKVKGRQMRRSLETDDRVLAKRRLTDLQRDLLRLDVGAGRLSLAELCERFLATVANQSASTREQKTQIATRIRTEWPGGSHVAIGKVTPSNIATSAKVLRVPCSCVSSRTRAKSASWREFSGSSGGATLPSYATA